MKIININNWNRKHLFNHFKDFTDPYFAVTIPFDVTKTYNFCKSNEVSFFGKYLYDCMQAINSVENLRYRIVNGNVVNYDVIHASPTIARIDNTYGFSFIKYTEDLNGFLLNVENEKNRVQNTTELYPKEEERLDCIHCSALPWINFTGHKEPSSGRPDSVPKLAFSKIDNQTNKKTMNVAVAVNHALVDGYHLGQFAEHFQNNLNKIDIK